MKIHLNAVVVFSDRTSIHPYLVSKIQTHKNQAKEEKVVKIRLAHDKDYSGIARLHRQTIQKVNSKDYPEDIIAVWSARTKAKRFRDSADKCKRWVAVDHDKIIGFCDHNFKCELSGIYVYSNYLGRGVGSRLLAVAEKSLCKQGCKKITVKSTLTAKSFYKKNGYTIVRRGIHKIENKKVQIYILTKKLD